MGINKYNSEGYYDPTVYEALSNIEKRKSGKACIPAAGLYMLSLRW